MDRRLARIAIELHRRGAAGLAGEKLAAERRAKAKTILESSLNHPKQYACLVDPARRVAAQCTRRAGKSSGWNKRMVYDAIHHPGSHQLYINTTWPECKRIAWRGANPKDGVASLNREHDLGGVERIGDRMVVWPDLDSIIEFRPADDERAIEKALGGAYWRVVIDEAQKMPHIQRLVEQVLSPAMMDFGGQIVMVGTASRDLHGLFWEATDPDSGVDRSGWSVHHWSVTDNPWFGDTPEERWNRTAALALEQDNLKPDDPEFLREWGGKWVREDARHVYHVHKVKEDDLLYAPARVDEAGFPDIAACVEDLPLGRRGGRLDWMYLLGSDFGYFPDPFSLTCWAFSFDRPELFELFSWRQTEMTSDQQRDVFHRVMDTIPLMSIVGDASGQKAVFAGWSEGVEDRLCVPIDEAKKARKHDYQELYNNDVRAGRIKLRRGGLLYAEQARIPLLISKTGVAKEDGRRDKDGKRKFPNDCSDAGLYSYREARHYMHVDEVDQPEPGTDEYNEELQRRAKQEIIELARRESGRGIL